MIVMRLKGGLANQIFQYALGRRLAIDRNTDLMLDTASYRYDRLREYRLDVFNIKASASDSLPFVATDSRFKYVNHIFQKIKSLFTKPYQIIKEKGFPFDPTILECSDQAYLDGFWQSEQYFDSVAQIIREDLALKTPITGELKKLAEQIKATPNSVSLHVRRGDYVSNPVTTAFHGVCGVDWYMQAAGMMEERLSNPTFFVFSDDYEWAKANLHFQSNAVFIKPSPDGQECNDLHVMSLCQNNIIANSSFSWWGAWLNTNPNKIVIAPKVWFVGGPQDTRDLIPSSWVRI